ncbi:cytochrome c oxidase assembly protein [Aureivirga sp. CE67]|uniref:cytochrome c oxidase assembly protein n=1 Tax=Aureivirga sp. CE67 TaxID=1788983 RepID=UPI0018CB9B57|nr:cytochrome c oxidase assembly protein [Aureivirga sp. CE67]
MKEFLLHYKGWQWPAYFNLILLFLIFWFVIMFKNKKTTSKNIWNFAFAVILIAYSLVSPLATLADGHSFIAHMTQHVILLMVVPALLWMSLPKGTKITWRIFRYPMISWVVFIAYMWFVHLPFFITEMANHIHNASEFTVNLLHVFGVISSLAVGLWFYYPVLAPKPNPTMPILKSVGYLVSACVGCTLLGIYITFAETLIYDPFYAESGFASRLSNLDKFQEQQISGLIMWLPGCLIYLTISMNLILKWLKKKEVINEKMRVL